MKDITPFDFQQTDLAIQIRQLLYEAKFQEALDSAIAVADELEGSDRLNELGNAYRLVGSGYYRLCRYDEALVSQRRSIALFVASGHVSAEAFVRDSSALSLMNLGDSQGAMGELQESLRLYESIEDRIGIASVLKDTAMVHNRRGNFDTAIELNLRCIEILSQLPLDGTPARFYLFGALVSVAGILHDTGNSAAALPYQLRALEMAEPHQLGSLYLDMATVYTGLGDRILSMKYLRHAYAELKGRPNSEEFIMVLKNIAARLNRAGNHGRAAFYLEQVCRHHEKSGSRFRSAQSLAKLGFTYARNGREAEGLELLERALVIAEELDNPRTLEYVHSHFHQYHLALHDYKRALEHYTTAQQIGRESINTETKEKLESARHRFERERELREEEIRQRNDVVKAVIEAQEIERQRIARDLHDGIGQTLAAAAINLLRHNEILKRTEEGASHDEELGASLERSMRILDQASREVRAISHGLGTSTLRELGLAAALEELLQYLESEGRTRFEFATFDLQGRLPEMIETGLFRIAQELITNILRHAGAEEATVQILKEESEVRLTVEDYGDGFDLDAPRAGMGLSNITARVLAMEGRIHYDSTPGHGTTVTVVVRV